MDNSSKLELKFKQTLKKIGISKKKKIIVALSGGKDSSVVAYLLHNLGYNIEGFHIDLKIGKYSDECLEKVKELCKQLNIKLHIYDIKKQMGSGMCYIRTTIQEKHKKTKKTEIKNCAICGVIKKWILNKAIRNIKADYIATGHNLDDEAQTFLMNVLKGSPQLSSNSGAITKNIPDKKFIPRIKPLFYISENEVREYSKIKKLPVNYEKCPCALDSYRIQIRNFLEKIPEKQKQNILKNLDRISNKIKKLKSKDIRYCEICNEPSRGEICKKCELMK